MYILLSLPVLLLSTILMGRANGSLSLRQLSMPTYAFYVLVLTTFIGADLLAQGLLWQTHLDGLSDPSLIVVGWCAVMYTMIAFPSGMLLANACARGTPGPALLAEYRQKPVTPLFHAGEGSMRAALQLMTLLGLLSLVYTWTQLESVPLLNVLRGERDATLLALQRTNSRLDGGALTAMVELVIVYLQVVAIAAYAYWAGWRRQRDYTWFVVAVIITAASLMYNISKGPLMMFMASFLIAIATVRGRVGWRIIISLAGSGLCIAIAMYVVYRNALSNNRGLGTVLYGVVAGRAGTGQLVSFYLSMDIFPRLLPHIGFTSTGRLIHEVLGLSFRPDYGIAVMAIFDPAGVEAGLAGHATGVFLAEAWANFGWVGLLLAPPLAGFFIQAFHRGFMRLRKTPLAVGVYTYLSLTFAADLTSGIQGFYYPAGIAQLFVVTGAVIGLGAFLRLTQQPPLPLVGAPPSRP